MKPDLPDDLLRQAADWNQMHRWERSELGRALRKLGMTYGEIRDLIPVPKSTLSNWCHGIRLTDEQVAAIKARGHSVSGVPRDTQRKRRQDVEQIRAEARLEARTLLADPLFVGGVVMYWAEGSKWRNDFAVANTDPAALRLFIRWVREYLNAAAEFRLSLHLHEGNDDESAKVYWRGALGLPTALFTKTYIKPKGTGHRKNHLPAGVCRVRVMKASNHWNRTMAWIEYVGEHMS